MNNLTAARSSLVQILRNRAESLPPSDQFERQLLTDCLNGKLSADAMRTVDALIVYTRALESDLKALQDQIQEAAASIDKLRTNIRRQVLRKS